MLFIVSSSVLSSPQTTAEEFSSPRIPRPDLSHFSGKDWPGRPCCFQTDRTRLGSHLLLSKYWNEDSVLTQDTQPTNPPHSLRTFSQPRSRDTSSQTSCMTRWMVSRKGSGRSPCSTRCCTLSRAVLWWQNRLYIFFSYFFFLQFLSVYVYLFIEEKSIK